MGAFYRLREAARKLGFAAPILRGRTQVAIGMSDVIKYSWRTDDVTVNVMYRSLSYGDRGVIAQIFKTQDYEIDGFEQGQRLRALSNRINAEGKIALIIDAGANIGASSVFFAQRYPSSYIYAIEPDPNNCALTRLNVRHFKATVFEGAIGSVQGEMILENPGRGDWGFMTSRVEMGAQLKGPRVPIITPNDILSKMGDRYFPLICKIDIEGGEADLFAANLEWMTKFGLIIVELHDWMLPFQGTSTNFIRAVAERNFEFLHRGENIFLFNRDLLE